MSEAALSSLPLRMPPARASIDPMRPAIARTNGVLSHPDTKRADDDRYRRAKAAYMQLLREGRLRCGPACPLHAAGHCTSRCW